MKIFLISDNVDTLMGMRLGGIDGAIVHDEGTLKTVLDDVLNNPEIGIVLMTTQAFDLDRDHLMELKLELKKPLIVEISDRHHSHEVQSMLDETIRKIVGKVT
ncbi:ATPase [Erysipelothrix larvae]|uniref:ATPase n=1 Tax=Erysipelothrix larvae TaxID=1514105 RepID=A0A109UHP8_9FIRM|nr:V-type ATP synthase subunit F [Erysipelothrix larvae]AMC94588.1 ATPase [Erysipelothrix larvae]